jgi:hypothetical protein
MVTPKFGAVFAPVTLFGAVALYIAAVGLGTV